MQRLFSGIQPSGNLHLGNYLGAIKQWVELQDQYEAIFCVVDLHAITVPQDPVELRKKTLEIAKIALAAGLDPSKCTIFIQSHVSAHTELGWILNTITKNGDLTKMTQFKDKSGFNIDELTQMVLTKTVSRMVPGGPMVQTEEIDPGVKQVLSDFKERYNSVGVGLFDYPVLMAADILLYDTAVVPVGDDQKQHVELTRDLAERFNRRFGETFVVPEPRIYSGAGRIMGLDDPEKKMSKSAASEYNYIALTDDADTVRRKIKKAVTDSGSEVVYSDEKPALKNLLNIYQFLDPSQPTLQEIQQKYQGKGYGDFKNDLAEVVVNFLTPFQERLAAVSDEQVLEILRQGAQKARVLADAKLKAVYQKVGFIC